MAVLHLNAGDDNDDV